jgi:hypothetical protein
MAKDKAIAVTGHGGLNSCEMSRITDGSGIVSIRHQLPFTIRRIPRTHFCYNHKAILWLEVIRSNEKIK